MPSVSLMPACQVTQATVPDADVDSAASFLGYLYIVSQYTVKANDSLRLAHFLPPQLKLCAYFRQPPNLPTAARRNRKCIECGTTAFGRNRMSAVSTHLSTFGAETEAEIRSPGLLLYSGILQEPLNTRLKCATQWLQLKG